MAGNSVEKFVGNEGFVKDGVTTVDVQELYREPVLSTLIFAEILVLS